MKKVRLTFIWPDNNGTVFAGHYGAKHRYRVYRPRGTDDWQLLSTTAGRGRIGSVNGPLEVVPGDLVLMKPGVLHDYSPAIFPQTGAARDERSGFDVAPDAIVGPDRLAWEYDWVHFQPRQEWLDLLVWPEHAPGLMHLTLDDPVLQASVTAALARTLTSYPYHRRQLFVMNALEEALLWCDLQNPLSRNRAVDPRILRVMAYLSENLAEKVTLSGLAEMAAMSASRLSHLFHEQVGMGPIQYLDIQRLEHARRLLENTDTPITRIAGEVGFDLRYFSVRFKQYTTLNPRAYRKRAANPPTPAAPGIL